MAMPKGPIVQHHFLLIPKQHIASTAKCSAAVLKEMEDVVEKQMYDASNAE